MQSSGSKPTHWRGKDGIVHATWLDRPDALTGRVRDWYLTTPCGITIYAAYDRRDLEYPKMSLVALPVTCFGCMENG